MADDEVDTLANLAFSLGIKLVLRLGHVGCDEAEDGGKDDEGLHSLWPTMMPLADIL